MVFKNFKTWKHSSVIRELKIFGSYARQTLLPRVVDPQSDVDILVIFKYDYRTKSESYFELLEDFATTFYSEDVILRDDPCIVLNLQGIKIEMSPTIEMGASINRQIPNYDKRTNKLLEWTFTNPFEVIDVSMSKDRETGGLYLPMVRLLKY